MSLLSRLQSKRFLGIAVFGENRIASFPVGTVGNEGFTRMRVLVGLLDAASADQQGAKNELGGETRGKTQAFLEIRGLVNSISGTAELMGAARTREFAEPTNAAELSFINSATAYLPQLSAPVVAEFVRYGLASDFKTRLETALAEYNAARENQTGGEQTQAGETSEVYALIDEGVRLVKVLDRVVKNVFGADKDVMALWSKAKRLDEDHAHRAAVQPTQKLAA